MTLSADHWLVASWRQSLRKVVESQGSSAEESMAGPADPAAWQQWSGAVWSRLELDGAPEAWICAGAPAGSVGALAGLLAAGMSLSEAEAQETLLELLNQVASGVADAVSARMGKRVSFSPARTAGIPAELDLAVQLDIPADGVAHAMALVASQALIEAAEGQPEPAAAELIPAAASSSAVSATTHASANLDLLLEVELPVSVTFGRTQLPLRDVLKLTSGSIVELNRLANEPVELVINDSVIARGEVVVVEGNYGIRVTEIASRQERIRSIL